MTSLYEVLKASRIPSAAPDAYTALWAKVLTGGGYTPTEREYTGAVPVTITADGTPLLDFLISGNTSHTGTPTPDNPIMPQGTGERTGNEFDKSNINYYNGYFDSGNNKIASYPTNAMIYVPIEYGKTYTVSGVIRYSMSVNQRYLLTKNIPISGEVPTRNFIKAVSEPLTFTAENDENYLCIMICGDSDYSGYGSVNNAITSNTANIMLNRGSTALPYDPHGYKIPISSASTTTPVYLGEVQTTRKIRKLVLTGEETAYAYEYSGNNGYSIRDVLDTSYSRAEGYCSHYVVSTATPSSGTTQVLWIGASNTHLYFVGIADIIGTTSANDFKQWLAQQYAAGTPVTIWYVLAESTTATVNEPLMKIGTYVDTVSMEQAGVSIPTLNGQTVVDVDTILKPSEVYIKYKG